MTNIPLTPFEIEVAQALVDHTFMCGSYCYMDYKTDMCDKRLPNGEYRCKLRRAVCSIQKKLGNSDYEG